MHWHCCCNVKVKVTLRLTVSQSVSLGVEQIFITVWQLRSCFCGESSLTWGRVCLLYMLLALASAVFLGSESLGTRDHILLSQIWDFPFCRLLQLAGSRWRYSAPPPHGDVMSFFKYCLISVVRTFAEVQSISYVDSEVRGLSLYWVWCTQNLSAGFSIATWMAV
jgi:hypothetical protein